MEASTATGRAASRPRLAKLLRHNSPLLRLQSDECLVTLTRDGNQAAFEALVRRYQPRLLAFCTHMLGATGRGDAEDVVQESFVAAYRAMIADERPIEVRPWLYRIARNRCLNHLRGGAMATARPAKGNGEVALERQLAEGGLSAADQAGRREDLRRLVGDVRGLPEGQRSALILRELEAMSYEEVAEAMSTTVPSVKSLLVRARLSLVDVAEGRELPCSEVRYGLAQREEGIRSLDGAERAHVKACPACAAVEKPLKKTKRATRSRAAAALAPVGLVGLVHRMLPAKLGGGGGAATTGWVAAGSTGGSAIGASGLSSGAGALVAKAATVALLAGTALTVGTHGSAPPPPQPTSNGVSATPVQQPGPVATPVRAETSASPERHPAQRSNASSADRPGRPSGSHHSSSNAKSGPSPTSPSSGERAAIKPDDRCGGVARLHPPPDGVGAAADQLCGGNVAEPGQATRCASAPQTTGADSPPQAAPAPELARSSRYPAIKRQRRPFPAIERSSREALRSGDQATACFRR